MNSNSTEQNVDIMSFNKEKLNLINNDFNRKGEGGLALNEFIQIMLHHSDISDEKTKLLYIESLIEAFEQIDVNGDESLEWDEFSNFIVETGIARQKKSFIDVVRNYHLSPLKDTQKHETEINKLFFFPKLKHLFALEHESRRIKIYHYISGALLYNFESHNGTVICAEYINQNIVVTSGSDNALMFWDPENKYRLLNKIPTREIQLVLKWVPSKKMLLTAGFDEVINCYRRLEFEESGKLKNTIDLVSLKRIHFLPITDILVVETHNYIVACDLEGVITLWNLSTLELKNQLKQHLKGVLSLAFIEGKNILLSAGYEHEVFMWDIVVGKKISSLLGHSQSLIGIKTIPGTPQVITGDVSGIFKVWDTRTMSLVQTFSTPSSLNKKPQANTFIATTAFKKKVIIGSDKIYFYDYEESREGDLADSKSCISVIYNEVFNTFISAHIDAIKVWDASTGALKNVFRDIAESEISCITFDKRKRKLFIGDVEGRLYLINILNGVQMKYFTKHKDYISSMTCFTEGKKFISGSWDGIVKIHDDESADEKGQLLFEFNSTISHGINSCNSVDFSDSLNILANGFDNGNVTLINMKSLSSEGTLSEKKAIKLVSFLNDLSGIVICDSGGYIHFWTLIPTKPKKLMKESTEENRSTNENNKREFFQVKCLSFQEQTAILVTGDETGYLKAWKMDNYVGYLKYIKEKDALGPKGHGGIHYSDPNAGKESSAFTTEGAEYGTHLYTLDKLLKYKEGKDLKVTLHKEWKCHKLGVTGITCHYDPVFYASSGQDCRILVWNENFELIGNLTTIKDPKWGLNINLDKKKKEREEQAIQLYEEMKKVSYDDLFNGDISIQLLESEEQY